MSNVKTYLCQVGAPGAAGKVYVAGCQLGELPDRYREGAEISSGAIAVKNEYGVTISGLVVGNWYAVEAFNGAYTLGDGSSGWCFGARNDGGKILWSNTMGHFYHAPTGIHYYFESIPAWGAHLEWVTADYVRMYWRATTETISVGVNDTEGYYGDNGGSLSWRLRSAEVGGLWVCGVEM